ncbi:hypothetical protein EMIHUDRAFT_203954 [Emiliania huxleyi CCMP1516]|uniref:Uncharacterized protein n=2 Tax=Emiliania huxleyi TaxID=2903 RepID=A0A0D3K0P9_EMIH1|nr:hypothetical protein EMIHUDRAFT_203954 [Emiliania huxleyi CCMP1516]EOD29334.1 hypothetical protein EMIHUDRAFT_203954 [Emiliania huxleyi CCMP1516]|eukprot:XP_005781763.1 hypothetical protein EMIHUDRAFT_203954 [Emiliania huxleyi CCMP1516]
MASAVHVLDSVAEAKRRKRKREDARAALDGHTVLSTGSRLEIFCDSERCYNCTLRPSWRGRRTGTRDGRIVHEVEYDGYSGRRWWHILDDERALADTLEAEDDEQQEEAARGDERLMLAPHGPALSVQLRRVRLRLREFLATQAAAGKSVPMQRTALGLHPTWLATTRIIAPRASRWHATERGDAREEEPTVRTGRGENTVYIGLQHMKNHVWREIWPAMPSDARQYWRLVTNQAAGREAARESASHGQSKAAQRAASERASAEASRRTMAELREATTKPSMKQHLFQVGEYQMQDTQLIEPFEVNVAFIMNAYLCFARQTGFLERVL